MPRVHFVQSARKANPSAGIEVGDSYYWWKFRRGGKQCSKTRPKPWQLTQSPFLQNLYQLQDELQNFGEDDLNEERVEEICERIEEMKDECEESLYNMPDSLQYSPTGELLQERIDAMDCWADELRSIEIPLIDDAGEPEEPDCDEEDDPAAWDQFEDDLNEWQALQDDIERAVEEFQNCEPGI